MERTPCADEGSERAVAKSSAARAGHVATMHVSQLSAYRLSPQECRDVSDQPSRRHIVTTWPYYYPK